MADDQDIKVAVNENDIEEIKDDLDTIKGAVLEGNGEPPLLSRVSSLETKMRLVFSGLATIGGTIAGFFHKWM